MAESRSGPRPLEPVIRVPVADPQAFVFTGNVRSGARARTLKEFNGLVAALPAERLVGHLRRHDFSRWIEEVFRDRPLASHLRKVEDGVDTDDPRDIADAVAQAIRARYDTAVNTRSAGGSSSSTGVNGGPDAVDTHRR